MNTQDNASPTAETGTSSENGKETGVKATGFVFLTIVVLFLLFVIGMALAPQTMPSWQEFLSYLVEVGIKIAISALWGMAFFAFFWHFVFDASLFSFREKLDSCRNDSYSIVFATLVVGMPTTILLFAGGGNFQTFLSLILTKGSIGIAFGTVMVLITALLLGVRSLDGFKGWIEEEDNNNYIFLCAFIFLAAIAIAVKSA